MCMSGPKMKRQLIFLLNTSKLQEWTTWTIVDNCRSLALKSIPAQKLKSETGLDGLYWKAPLICATLCGANNFWLQKQQLRFDCGHTERIFTSAHNMTIFSSQANIHPGQTNKMFFYHPRAESWGESINFLYIFISHGTVHRLEHWKILLKVCDNNQLVTDSLMKLTSLPFVREDGLPGVEAEPALQRPFQLDFWSRWSTGVMMVKRRKEIGHRLACPHFPSRCRPRHQVGRR